MFEQILKEVGLLEKKYKILSSNLINKIKDYLEEYELDDEVFNELPSTYYDSNPYGVEDQLIGSSGGYFNDNDDEILEKKLEILLNELSGNDIEYVIETITDEDFQNHTIDEINSNDKLRDLFLKEIKEEFS